MATDQRQLPANLPNDADFRTWGQGIAAQLAAMGLVKAADTGQIDWSTVTKPTVISTFAGYEIWRFNDSLQATRPVFIKIEYGVSSAVDRPGLRFSVATGTNGAGTLTGGVTNLVTVSPSGSKSSGATLPSFCSGSSSRLNLFTNHDASNGSFFMGLFVERTKNASGQDTADGVVFFALYAGVTVAYQIITAGGLVSAFMSTSPTVAVSAGLTQVGGNLVLMPAIIFCGGVFLASWLVYRSGEIPNDLVPITVTHFGGPHTYLPLAAGSTAAGLTAQSSSNTHYLAMLWE